MKKFLKSTYGLWLTAAFCCFLWGSAFPAIKAGYRLFSIKSSDTASIILFAGVRFILAGALTVIIFSVAEKKALLPNKSSVKSIGVLSLFQTVIQYVFFYLGLAFTSGARGSVINASSVFFALLISSLIFKMERLKLSKIIGSIIGFIGVILVSLESLGGGFTGIKGETFILISSISYAFSSVFMKRFSENENPAMLSGWQFMLGGTVMTAFALAFGGSITQISPKGAVLLIYMALISALAYSLWSILLKYNEVSRVAVCGFLIPVFGYFLSALFEKEGYVISFLSIGALIMVVTGIIVVNYDNKRYNIK